MDTNDQEDTMKDLYLIFYPGLVRQLLHEQNVEVKSIKRQYSRI